MFLVFIVAATNASNALRISFRDVSEAHEVLKKEKAADLELLAQLQNRVANMEKSSQDAAKDATLTVSKLVCKARNRSLTDFTYFGFTDGGTRPSEHCKATA